MENSNGHSRLNLRLPSPEQLRNSGLISSSRNIRIPESLNVTNSSMLSKESQPESKSAKQSLGTKKPTKKKVLSARNSPNVSRRPTASPHQSPRASNKTKVSLAKIKALLEKCNSNLLRNLQQLGDIDNKLRKLEFQESYH